MNILQKWFFRFRTGSNIEVFNDGNSSEEYVIRFKNIYISVLEGDGTYSVSWSGNVSMFHVPVREFWKAVPPAKKLPARFQDIDKDIENRL